MPTERELKEADRRRREKQQARDEEPWDSRLVRYWAYVELAGLSILPLLGVIALGALVWDWLR